MIRQSKDVMHQAEATAKQSLEKTVARTEKAYGKIKRKVKSKAAALGLRKPTMTAFSGAENASDVGHEDAPVDGGVESDGAAESDESDTEKPNTAASPSPL